MTPSPPLRAALYLRVSTDDQVEKYGLPSQRRALHELVARRGYRIVGEFPDEGVSGATLDRPHLSKLRDLVAARGVDVVLAHGSDRLARDLVLLLTITGELRRAGVKIEYVTHVPDDSPLGAFREQIDGAVDQLERARIRERTIRGRREKAIRGLVPAGPAPFGYKLVAKGNAKSKGSGKYKIDETQAPIVKRIYGWLLDGASVHAIVRRLRRQDIPSPRGKRWGTASVRRILTSETYTGRVYYNRCMYSGRRRAALRDRDDWIPIDIPPIIPRPTWERAQAAIRRNARVLVGRPSPRIYLLKGVCRCPAGHAMVGQASHGRALYRCRARYRIDGVARCDAPSIGAVRLERAVWEAISATLRNPELLRSTAEASRLGIDARQVDAREQATELRRKLADVSQARELLLDLYESNGLEKARFMARDARLVAAEQEHRAELARYEAVLATATAEASRHAAVLKHCQLLARGLDRMDAAARQALVRKLVDRIDVSPDRVTIHGILPVAPTDPARPRRGDDASRAESRPPRGHVAYRAESYGARWQHDHHARPRVSLHPGHDAGPRRRRVDPRRRRDPPG